MEGESGEQVGDEWESMWRHQKSVLCKADGMRQEVGYWDEVLHSGIQPSNEPLLWGRAGE